MNSAKTATRRLKAVLPRCQDCHLHRVNEAGMTCPYCQRLRDNIARSEQVRKEFIAVHGHAAWELKQERELKELF